MSVPLGIKIIKIRGCIRVNENQSVNWEEKKRGEKEKKE